VRNHGSTRGGTSPAAACVWHGAVMASAANGISKWRNNGENNGMAAMAWRKA